MRCHTEKQEYLAALERETHALLGAAHKGLEAAVPSCPGWVVGDVVAHVGRAMNWMGEIVRTRAQSASWPDSSIHGLDWRALEVLEWFEESRDRFLTIMSQTDPDEPVWSWAGDNRAIFWLRLESLEAGVHRWDAQGAHGRPDPIDTALATDGIDPTIRWFLPARRPRSTLPDRGERYRFDQTDGPGRWAIHFANGKVMPGPGHEDADVVASGTASEILLYLWNRMQASALDVTGGDKELLQRFGRLVPPI